jgi:hypothetical protein
MEPTEAEKKTARRAQRLLYALMVVMVAAPTVIYLVRLY